MEALQELLTEQLQDLYDAEKQLTKALPKLAKAASDQELRTALTDHLEVTKSQVARLEEAFNLLGTRAKGKPCKGMKGLVEEGQEHLGEHEKGAMRDVALIGSAERVEHYEMAGYLAARSTARIMGNRKIAELLLETLREEEQAGKQLLQLGDKLQKGMQEPRSKSNGKSQAKAHAPSNGRSNGKSNGTMKARQGRAGSIVTTDHDEIREWAEARGAKPACVKGTGKRGDTGLLRLDFPGYSGSESLQEISWDDWFGKFDEQGLALLHQEKTARGQTSNFNKLVAREGTPRRR